MENIKIENICEMFEVPKKAYWLRGMIDFLVKNDQDLDELLDAVEKEELFFALDKLHVKKANRVLETMSQEDFLRNFEVNPKSALEILFQQPVDQGDIDQLDKCIKNGRITLELLHQKHIENVRKPLQNFLTGRIAV